RHHQELHSFPTRRSSDLKKKKSLFLSIGPPTVPPNMFQRRGGLSALLNLFSQEFEFSLSLRKYSQRSPWKLLVPDLIVALTMPRSEEHTFELQSRGHLVC